MEKLKMEQNRTSPIMSYIAYGYLTLPFLIFIFGWFRLIFAIPAALAVLVGLFFVCRHAPRLWTPQFDKKTLLTLAGVAAIALVWVYFSGIGGYVYQNYDHKWRNAIFELLVKERWPVIIEDTLGYFDGPVALVYYFAFWLPAAVVGKGLGLAAGYSFLFVWALIGALLVLYFLSALQNKVSVWFVLIFVFFSGLDIVGKFFLSNTADFIWFGTSHLENWTPGFQYSSMTTQLFWVFNQALPAWLITLMLLCQRDNRSMVFLYSFSLLSCSLPAIGMIPLFAAVGLKNCIDGWSREETVRTNIIRLLRDVFTFQNLVSGGIVGITSYLFLKINTSGKAMTMIELDKSLMSYLLFVFFEFLILCFFIRLQKGERLVYYITVATLLAVPLFKVGSSIDFVMRASIPALTVLCTYAIGALTEHLKNKRRLLAAGLIAVILIGALTPLAEISRTAVNTVNANRDGKPVIAEEIELIEDGHRNNFFGELEDSLFFSIIAKKD